MGNKEAARDYFEKAVAAAVPGQEGVSLQVGFPGISARVS